MHYLLNCFRLPCHRRSRCGNRRHPGLQIDISWVGLIVVQAEVEGNTGAALIAKQRFSSPEASSSLQITFFISYHCISEDCNDIIINSG